MSAVSRQRQANYRSRKKLPIHPEDMVQVCEKLHVRLTKTACANRHLYARMNMVHVERYAMCRSCEIGAANATECA